MRLTLGETFVSEGLGAIETIGLGFAQMGRGLRGSQGGGRRSPPESPPLSELFGGDSIETRWLGYSIDRSASAEFEGSGAQ